MACNWEEKWTMISISIKAAALYCELTWFYLLEYIAFKHSFYHLVYVLLWFNLWLNNDVEVFIQDWEVKWRRFLLLLSGSNSVL